MKPCRSQTVDAFLTDLAAKTPAPGGGAAGALAAALGAAMAQMVAAYTAGHEKYAAVDAEARALLEELGRARNELLTLADRDAEAYAAFSAARKRPKSNDIEKAERKAAMDLAREHCVQVPLEILAHGTAALHLIKRLVEIGNVQLLADAAVAAYALEAGLRAAGLQVRGNLSKKEANRAADAVAQVTNARALSAEIEQAVLKKLGLSDDT